MALGPGDLTRARLELADALRTRRLAQDLRLRDVAARAGISETYLSDIERATKFPTLEVLLELAAALDADVVGLIQRRVPFDRSAPAGPAPEVQRGRRAPSPPSAQPSPDKPNP